MGKRKKNQNNKTYSDTVYKTLLENYKPLRLSEEKNKKLQKKLEQIIFKPESRPSFFKIASIAAIVLLVPMTILYIADRTLPFSSPLLISFREDPTGDQYITRQGSLITESGESLVFQSDSEIFLLYPQTDFQLKRVLLSRLKEGQNIHYTLNEGTLEINRDNALQKEHLKIETVLGEIILGQGRFKLTSGKQKIILICFEGQLNYISSDRSQTFVLSKNQILEVEKDERGLYQIKTETLNSDRIQKEKTHMPEFRRSEQQNEKKPIISEPIEPKDDPLSEAVPEEMRSEEINQKKPEELQSTESSANLPVEQPLLNIQWEKNIESGSTSIILSDHYLILMGMDNTIHWQNLHDGSEAGTFQFDFRPENYQIFQDILYIYNNQELSALDLNEKKIIWHSEAYSMAYTTFSVDNQNIALPSADGKLYLFNRKDGALEKKIEADTGLYSKPLFIDRNILFSTMSGKIYSVNRDSSEVNWIFEAKNRLIGDIPVFIQEKSYIIFQDNTNKLITLSSDDGSEIFSESRLNGKRQDILFLKNTLFILTENQILALNPLGDLLYKITGESPFSSIFRTGDDFPGLITETGISFIEQGDLKAGIYNFPIKISAVNSSHIAIVTKNNTLRIFQIKGY